MDIENYKNAIEAIAYGVSILSGSIAIKYLINAVKYFILHILPMIKKTDKNFTANNEHCAYHDCIDGHITDIKEVEKTAIKNEARTDELFRKFDDQSKLNDEIFDRLRKVEISNGILDDRDKRK